MRSRWMTGFAYVVMLALAGGCTYSKSMSYNMSPEESVGSIHEDWSRPDDGVRKSSLASPTGQRGGEDWELFGQAPQAQLAADEQSPVAPADRLLIYSADATIRVGNPEESVTLAKQIAEDAGGYMQSMTSTGITIRVPAKKFFDVMAKLEQMGQVLHKNVHAQDVTDQYVDLKLRLKNAENLHARLEAILAKAEKIEDVLKIEKELSKAREEIERIKGVLQSLDKRISLSTINLSFQKVAETPDAKPLAKAPFAWMNRMSVENVLGINN